MTTAAVKKPVMNSPSFFFFNAIISVVIQQPLRGLDQLLVANDSVIA